MAPRRNYRRLSRSLLIEPDDRCRLLAFRRTNVDVSKPAVLIDCRARGCLVMDRSASDWLASNLRERRPHYENEVVNHRRDCGVFNFHGEKSRVEFGRATFTLNSRNCMIFDCQLEVCDESWPVRRLGCRISRAPVKTDEGIARSLCLEHRMRHKVSFDGRELPTEFVTSRQLGQSPGARGVSIEKTSRRPSANCRVGGDYGVRGHSSPMKWRAN